MKTLVVGWNYIQVHAESLSYKIKASFGHQKKWRGVIAIARGGLAPAVIIAHCLGISRVVSLQVASRGDDGDILPQTTVYNDSHDARPLATTVQDHGEDWLIVDDLIDSGTTAQRVMKLFPKAVYAVLFAKPEGKGLASIYEEDLPQDIWIVFPWEHRKSSRTGSVNATKVRAEDS